MKLIRTLALLACAVIIIWIDLPDGLRIGKTTLKPLVINTEIFGQKITKEFKTHLGLDLKGGSHLVFEADTKKVSQADLADALDSARNIIERRVNFFGVSEPTIQTVKSGNKYRINVDMPGITNTQEAIGLIGQTAQLTFRETIKPDKDLSTISAGLVSYSEKPSLTGKDVKKASVSFDQQTGKPQVALEFSSKGKNLFADVTKRNVNKQVGIFIDRAILSAPVVQQPILDGNAVITGSFTVDEAKKLAVSINSGALPVPIKLVEQRNIGPTLGAEEVEKSMTAGLIGLGAVMFFMVLYYGVFGITACLALLIYGLLTFAIFRAIPIVLTLPGVAGFILSIGMAVDSNILIFERIKEEIRNGLDMQRAISVGFGRAIDAIKDANITTLLVAFILFNPLNWEWLPQFGLVRGFALTLGIGVAMSLFTGIVITKRLINLIYKKN